MTSKDQCPNCLETGTFRCRNRDGTTSCSKCGYVISTVVFDESEDVRSFSPSHGEISSVRAGTIGTLGSTFAVSDSSKNRQYRQLQEQLTTDREAQRLNLDLQKIKECCRKLGITERKIVVDAENIFKECFPLLKERKVKRKPAVAAAIFKSLNDNGQSKTLDEICSVFKSTKRNPEVTKRDVNKALDALKLNTQIHPEDIAADYVEKLCKDNLLQEAVREFGKCISTNNICSGSKPSTLAASIVYFVSNHIQENYGTIDKFYISLERIAEISGVAKNTIQSTAQKFTPLLETLRNEESFKKIVEVSEKNDNL